MAPRKKTRAPARTIAARRTKQPRRRPRSTQKRSPVGNLIVKGVNAIMSAVPAASIFAPITDFLFKAVGFTAMSLSADTTETSTYIYGLGAAFGVPLSAIIENVPIIPKHHDGNKVQLYTNFSHGQLLQLRVTVRPISELGHRQGNLAIAFIPYTTEESGNYYNANVSIPTLQDVLIVPGAVQGSGTQTLSVNYRNRGLSWCNLPHPLATQIGLVLVAYQDVSRNKGSGFEAEDFGAEIIISGTVKLSSPLPHVGYSAVDCNVIDKLKNKVIRVNDFDVYDGNCEASSNGIIVTGRFERSSFTPCSLNGRSHPRCKMERRSGPALPVGSPSSVVSMLEDAAL